MMGKEDICYQTLPSLLTRNQFVTYYEAGKRQFGTYSHFLFWENKGRMKQILGIRIQMSRGKKKTQIEKKNGMR